jgi:hypothetical protein
MTLTLALRSRGTQRPRPEQGLGAFCVRTAVQRTSNAYAFNDPSSKSDFQTGTAAQAKPEGSFAHPRAKCYGQGGTAGNGSTAKASGRDRQQPLLSYLATQ